VEGLPALAGANHGHAKLLATAGSSSSATTDGATHRHLLWRRKWHNGGLGECRGERGRAEEVRASDGGSSERFWLSQREMEQQQTSSNGGGALWCMAATSPFHRTRGVHRSREDGTPEGLFRDELDHGHKLKFAQLGLLSNFD